MEETRDSERRPVDAVDITEENQREHIGLALHPLDFQGLALSPKEVPICIGLNDTPMSQDETSTWALLV